MKVFITKYALTKGLIEVEAEIVDGKYARTRDRYPMFTSEWAPTRAQAVSVAKAMRAKKIAALKKQIAKLEAMTFADGGGK